MVESTAETTTVEREIAIAARPETVWDFLVDEAKITRWMGTRAELDPRPGGIYLVGVIPNHTVRGEFMELDPPRRLVFTFGWEAGEDGPNPVPPGSSTITIDLVPDGDGTLLRFVHELASVESASNHSVGWDHYLGRLAIAAGGGDAGADPWLTGDM
jgi:uncharacterized protein YndB with AHSA1/START domain